MTAEHAQEPNLTRRRHRTWVQPELDAHRGEGWYRPEFDSEREGAVAVGVDVIEIDRIARVYEDFGERFLRKVFTERERERYRGRPNELAARFAAKEATSKALGTGIIGIRWKEMEVLSNRRGKPVLILHGQAAERARSLGLTDFSVSLTHSRTDAMAFVVAVNGARTSPIQQAVLGASVSFNTSDPDDDNDGIPDGVERRGFDPPLSVPARPSSAIDLNTASGGIANSHDPDDDNDGEKDAGTPSDFEPDIPR